MKECLVRDTKKASNTIPSKQQLKLLNKIFTDDEDDTLSFYVSEVKYFSDYGEICCFCVPYHGDVDEAKKLSKSATKKKKYDDDCIYDCDYVKGRVEEYRVHESLSM